MIKRHILLAIACLGSALVAPSHAANEVKLLQGFSISGGTHGGSMQDVGAVVKVKTLGTDGKVFVHSKSPAGTWVDLPMTKLGPADTGYELWRFDQQICNGFCTTYEQNWAIKYTVNGLAYWDNNAGNNYKLSQSDGWLLTDPKIMVAEKASISTSDGMARGKIAVRDTTFGKTVKVHYTLDGVTWQDAAAQHSSTVSFYGGYGSIMSPNKFGVETWTFAFSTGTSSYIKYAVNYTVNGQTYWDSNFGHNYEYSATLYPRMFVRGTTLTPWEPVPMSVSSVGSWQAQVTFTASEQNRFKFDVNNDWTTSFGDLAPADGIADLGAADIALPSAGTYQIVFNDHNKVYSVACLSGACKSTTGEDWQRTVVFIRKQTQPGQDMFIRGGIDHAYAKLQGKICTKENKLCAIPIKHLIKVQDTTSNANRLADLYLDWYGAESGQTTSTMGSPLSWTTKTWPAAWGAKKTVPVDGYGEYALNSWGDHYWLLEVSMDCAKTQNGWFELKAFVTGGIGWEPDIAQVGKPYSSINHFAKCGKLNKFDWAGNVAEITDIP